MANVGAMHQRPSVASVVPAGAACTKRGYPKKWGEEHVANSTSDVGGLVLVVVNGSARAVPIPPLVGIIAQVGDVTDVFWRRCWRDRWDRVRCR